MENQDKIAMEEFELNIRHQDVEVKEFTEFSYVFDDGVYVIGFFFPKDFLGTVEEREK